MMVGSGVGNWQFDLYIRAVRSFVNIATTCIAAPYELHSAKLHRNKTIVLSTLLNCDGHNNKVF